MSYYGSKVGVFVHGGQLQSTQYRKLGEINITLTNVMKFDNFH